MQKSKTHFEQIPVEIVKRIAKEIPAYDAFPNESESIESQGEATSVQDDWREMAQRVQKEQDPNRMIGLVQQLIERFDKEQLRGRRPPSRQHHSNDT